jgi:hypothetical protein
MALVIWACGSYSIGLYGTELIFLPSKDEFGAHFAAHKAEDEVVRLLARQTGMWKPGDVLYAKRREIGWS